MFSPLSLLTSSLKDPAGFAGVEVLNDTTNNVNIYVKKLQDSSFAVALLNRK